MLETKGWGFAGAIGSAKYAIKFAKMYDVRLVAIGLLVVLSAIGLGAGVQSPASAIRSATTTTPNPPSCTTATTNDGPSLHSIHPIFLSTAGSPFGVTTSPRSDTGYVADSVGTEVVPDLLTTPKSAGVLPAMGEGLAITPDGRFLLAATGSDVVATSTAPGATSSFPIDIGGGSGAIEVVITPNGHYAFASLEDSSDIAVLRLAESAHQLAGSFIGAIPVGEAPVGLAVSPDGRWLYSTSEGGGSLGGDYGSLRVINIARAEVDPASSVVATVDAGCEPVRVVTSSGGALVWVTARASDALLGFSAENALMTNPRHALAADVRVGEAPVGLVVARGGSRIVVADSNRFDEPGKHADLVVVNTTAALQNKPAVLGQISSGLFPRDIAATSDGRAIIIANYGSAQLEVVKTSGLP